MNSNTGGKVNPNPANTRISATANHRLKLTSLPRAMTWSTTPRPEEGNSPEDHLARQGADALADPVAHVELQELAEIGRNSVEDHEDPENEGTDPGGDERRGHGTIWLGLHVLHRSTPQATGAAFVMKAPKRPAAPAAAKARVKKMIAARRISPRWTS